MPTTTKLKKPTTYCLTLTCFLTLALPVSLFENRLQGETVHLSTFAKASSCDGRGLRRLVRAVLGRCLCQKDCVSSEKPQQPSAPAWRSLFDGKTLSGWKVPEFGGDGEVLVEDGRVTVDYGVQLSGITYTGEVPKTNYEISLEAMRVDGIDFFCGLTFPVEDSFCSFIVGGWAGAVVGLSNIDGEDASQNETTKIMNFKTGQWYKIRVRVTREKIEAWIDQQKVADQVITGRRISIRPEVELSQPLGISTWQTRSAWREIKIRSIKP